MRSFIFLLITSLSITACLNNGVLDKDKENSNFKESDFYTSGDFDRQFNFTVENVDLKTIVNPNDPSDILCEPTYTLRLNDNFAARLNAEWSDQIIITLFADELTADDKGIEFVFNKNYGQSIQFSGQAIECNATTSELGARLVLMAPNTGRATASITRKTLKITF